MGGPGLTEPIFRGPFRWHEAVRFASAVRPATRKRTTLTAARTGACSSPRRARGSLGQGLLPTRCAGRESEEG